MRPIFLALVLMASLSCGVAAAPAAEVSPIVARGGWIRVNLQSGVSSVRANVERGFRVLSGDAAVYSSPGAGSVELARSASGVSASVGGKVVASGESVTVEPDDAFHGTHFEIPKGRFRGKLVAQSSSGGLRLVNEIQIDDWLKGVLPAEIGSAHAEALKAQAVAARSEAVHKLRKPPHAADGYDFCTGVHCQAYKGMAAEENESNLACEATLGMVLLVNGKVLDGVYHNVCGGITAGAEDVWDSDPIPGISAILDVAGKPQTADLSTDAAAAKLINDNSPSYLCNPANPGPAVDSKKYFRWTKTVDAAALQKAGGVGRVRDVRVTERRPSGRVRKLQIVGERGARVIEKELPIRKALNLWSGLFVVSVEKQGEFVTNATFTGAGNGHGAGMCQMGARAMAVGGYSYDQILQHYYVGAQVQQIYRR